jgi:hypothetical protein
MFAVKTQLFSNLAPHEIGKFSSLEEAMAFAKTRFQFALEIWIEPCRGSGGQLRSSSESHRGWERSS